MTNVNREIDIYFQYNFSCLLCLYHVSLSSLRSSHRRCSVRKCDLRNFAKFTGKRLCQSLFFNKVASLRPASLLATLLKNRLWHSCFPIHFCKRFKNTFFTEYLWTKNTSIVKVIKICSKPIS